MPAFAYQARTREGKAIEGVLEAKSLEDARGALLYNEQLVWITSIRPVSTPLKFIQNYYPPIQSFLFPVTNREFAVFCQQFSSLLGGGVPVTASLETLIGLKKTGTLRDATQGVLKKIQQGKRMSEAFRAYPNVFSNFFCSMIEVGETSGNLDKILQELGDHYEYVNQVRVKVRTAMTYPVFIIGLIALLSLFAVFYLLPQFEGFYNSLKAPLPPITRFVITGGKIVRAHFVMGGVVIALILISFLRGIKTGKGREVWDGILLHFPILGHLVVEFNSLVFIKALVVLLSGGVSIITSLNIVSKVVPNRRFSRALEQACSKIQGGMTLGDTFKTIGVIHPIAQQMIGVGEKTGSTATLLEKAARFYDMEIKGLVDRMTAAIEPVLIFAIGIWVFFLLIALYLPLFKLAGQILKH